MRPGARLVQQQSLLEVQHRSIRIRTRTRAVLVGFPLLARSSGAVHEEASPPLVVGGGDRVLDHKHLALLRGGGGGRTEERGLLEAGVLGGVRAVQVDVCRARRPQVVSDCGFRAVDLRDRPQDELVRIALFGTHLLHVGDLVAQRLGGGRRHARAAPAPRANIKVAQRKERRVGGGADSLASDGAATRR